MNFTAGFVGVAAIITVGVTLAAWVRFCVWISDGSTWGLVLMLIPIMIAAFLLFAMAGGK